MTEYEAEFTFPVAFPPVSLTRILGEEVSRHGRRQLRIAETEKYAHVTYFFTGGIEVPLPARSASSSTRRATWPPTTRSRR